MKKIMMIVAVAALAIVIVPGLALARGSWGATAPCGNPAGTCAAVAAEGAAYDMFPGFVDEDGDGVCDNRGTGVGNGAGYVDEDGDGVCDNRANRGNGVGAGANYVDEDGDGQCDNRAERGKGYAYGRGFAGGR